MGASSKKRDGERERERERVREEIYTFKKERGGVLRRIGPDRHRRVFSILLRETSTLAYNRKIRFIALGGLGGNLKLAQCL